MLSSNIDKDTLEKNKELCRKYPFLIPYNRWSGMLITEASNGGYWPGSPESIPEYDYSYTELDDMPEGWRIAFGEQLCDELKQELELSNQMDKYRIIQIKEKYGILHWYDNSQSKKCMDIISKYVKLSERTCICCGKPATRITTTWISPYCDDCCKETSVPIDEYYSDQK